MTFKFGQDKIFAAKLSDRVWQLVPKRERPEMMQRLIREEKGKLRVSS